MTVRHSEVACYTRSVDAIACAILLKWSGMALKEAMTSKECAQCALAIGIKHQQLDYGT